MLLNLRELPSKLADLLAVPKEKRREFSEHVLGISDWGFHPDGIYPGCIRKGDAAFKKAEGHIRGLLGALDEIAKAGDAQLFVDAVSANFVAPQKSWPVCNMVDPSSPEFKRLADTLKRGEYPSDLTRAQLRTLGCALRLANGRYIIGFGKYEPPEPPPSPEEAVFDDRPGDYKFVSASTGEILDAVLRPIAAALADLVGRYPQDPQAKDPILNAVIRDIQTWPERFGAVGIAHTRSKTLEKAIGVLHEMMPDIVPGYVSPNTIKIIWKPRPRKGRKR